ncbi:unnamed protein product [Rangifer tarandus platyrhynchus]|uniref:Uncharacterized protein n=1 Tax=Rangifer tarandus platyrhynchus TaxID=3082113 RepID=A0ABN8YVG7_RANTA|nr:unnamed protein product [Rangifer tarandus platyrhynchus]
MEPPYFMTVHQKVKVRRLLSHFLLAERAAVRTRSAEMEVPWDAENARSLTAVFVSIAVDTVNRALIRFTLAAAWRKDWGEGAVRESRSLKSAEGNLEEGHLSSHCNVGIDQAGCRGHGRWAWNRSPALGAPTSSSGLGLWTAGSVYPDTCCFGSESPAPWGQRELCGLSSPGCGARAAALRALGV